MIFRKEYRMARLSKKEMLQTMKESGWICSLTENDSWQDIKDEYEIFKDEDGSVLYPNGIDYDAEDED